ncbi:MAG TPA: TetR/AcrR family transcriptional regulator [Actinomycetota bacterium]|nr:TetR/AcrR family transcriptional regulator [Actinomycetota bacterium]
MMDSVVVVRNASAERLSRGEETRSRILEAARQVLAEEGINRFTTRRVAAIAGVSHGMCHYHFKDKRDLVLALVEHARRDWVEPLERIVNGAGPAESRARSVIAWMAEPATIEVMRVHLALFWFALGDEEVREHLAGEYARWRKPFVTLFREVADELSLISLDPHGVGEAFASAADGLVQQQVLDPALQTEHLLTSLFNRIVAAERDVGTSGQKEPNLSRSTRGSK